MKRIILIAVLIIIIAGGSVIFVLVGGLFCFSVWSCDIQIFPLYRPY